MVNSRAKGYRVERKIRMLLEKEGWMIVRAGRSLGQADLLCLKNGRCMLLQIKSTSKKKFYYYEFTGKAIAGFPFYLVIDFGYGNIRIMHPQREVAMADGQDLHQFLGKH